LESNGFFKKIFFNWHVKILSVLAAVLLFAFNRMINLDENTLTIPLKVKLPDNFSISSPLPRDNVNVTIRGDKELSIRKITDDNIDAYIDLSSFNKEDIYTVKVFYEKKGAALSLSPISISIDPPEMKVSIEKTMQKTVRIIPSIKAETPTGYDYSYSLSPSYVAVIGPKKRIENSIAVTTEAIDLSSRTESFIEPVRIISSDPLIKLKEITQTVFDCIINEEIIEKTIEAKIKVQNLNPKLGVISKIPVFGTISVKLPPNLAEKIDQDAYSLVIDCTTIKNGGRHTVKLKAVAPEGIIVERFKPEEMTLDIGQN
jgi:YbbR domain-containing protein